MAVTERLDVDIIDQRDRLLSRLSDQRARVSDLWRWYRGRQDVPDVPSKYQQAYALFLQSAVTPWARLVVDAIAERLRVQGVEASDDDDAAELAWGGWKRSRLNADQRLVYVEALIGGTGYVSVAKRPDGRVFIVPESSLEVTHEPNLADQAVVAGALKLYPYDYTSTLWVCELYRPEGTYRWTVETTSPRAEGTFPIDSRRRAGALDWELVGDAAPNEVGMVPVIPFENRVNVLSGGASEIEDCIPILQRIDRLVLDQMLASAYSSFRQKWATGLQVPRDPDTGEPVEPYKAAVNRLWVNERADGKFGTFEASDITQYLSAVDSQIATLAAISRVPAHYLLQRNLANPPSAESLIASETGLVSKVQDRQASYGEAWEQALWLHAEMSGQPVEIETLQVQWVDAEKRNPAQVADAAVKWQAMGVPQPALWAYGEFTPQQVEDWQAENSAAQLLAAAIEQPPAEPQPTT